MTENPWCNFLSYLDPIKGQISALMFRTPAAYSFTD